MARHRVPRGLVVAAVLLAAATGCSGGPDDELPVAQPPASASPASTTAPSGSWTTDQQAVIEAVARYKQVMQTMEGGKKVDMDLIHTVAVEPYATKAGKNVGTLQSQGYVMIGEATRVTRSVTIGDDRATVVQCVDSSQRYPARKGTTAQAPGTRRAGKAVTTATLTRSGDAWKVASFTSGQPC